MNRLRLILVLPLLGLLAACGSGGKTVTEAPAGFTFEAQAFLGDEVDNPYFPLMPGSKYVFEGQTEDGLERVVVEVTALTKMILGVSCVVVRATETLDGELVEDTFDWYAQDNEGNVWYLGEDSKDYEDGAVVSTEGSWEAGKDGAAAGVIMPAIPTVGLTYAQESAPGIAEDMARVVGLNETATTPLGTFLACVKTEDFTPLEPEVLENKFYAPGIGTVLEMEPDGDRIELISIEYSPPFDAQQFVVGIDNPFMPLVPGTRHVYEKDTDDGLEVITVEVLAETREILGVTCTVVRDTVTVDGELLEDTFDWFAQDMRGNVWYLGEDSKEYEDGELVGTEGSWEAGVDGAEAGIIMMASPVVGTTYRQEYYEGVAEDMGTVLALGELVTVPQGTFAGCLKTADFTPLEPGVLEDKYYAPGVGLVLEVDEDGERTELISVEQPG